MLLPPASHSSHSSRTSRSNRFGRRRRRIRKLSVVCRLLGGLCLLAAVFFFVSSRMNEKKIARKQVFAGVVFLASAPVLFGVGLGLGWWKDRYYGRGQRRHPEAAAHGNGPRPGAEAAPHVADLPTR